MSIIKFTLFVDTTAYAYLIDLSSFDEDMMRIWNLVLENANQHGGYLCETAPRTKPSYMASPFRMFLYKMVVLAGFADDENVSNPLISIGGQLCTQRSDYAVVALLEDDEDADAEAAH